MVVKHQIDEDEGFKAQHNAYREGHRMILHQIDASVGLYVETEEEPVFFERQTVNGTETLRQLTKERYQKARDDKKRKLFVAAYDKIRPGTFLRMCRCCSPVISSVASRRRSAGAARAES
jgi:hypothetical protein